MCVHYDTRQRQTIQQRRARAAATAAASTAAAANNFNLPFNSCVREEKEKQRNKFSYVSCGRRRRR